MRPVLEVHALCGGHGGIMAVDMVSLHVMPGARHAVIGPNGAGKSTLFNLVAGTLPATSGRVLLDGVDISGLPDHGRVRAGLVKSFQQPSLFLPLTVLENVAMAVRRRAGSALSMRRPARSYGRVYRQAAEHVMAAGLSERRNDTAGSLSHGERRQLDLAMALATGPKVLLLDEPTAGMSAAGTARFVNLMHTLGSRVTAVIVEHDLDLVFGLATHVTVLHQGAVLADGPANLIRANAQVQRIYLGDDANGSLFPGRAAR